MSRRMIVYVPTDSYSEKHKGYIPSVVYENESGHYPLVGNGPFALPWVWGDDYEKATKIAAKHNASMGISEEEADKILTSSMFPAKRA
tara:strand:+ start:132 stop:395 length:264 start_codon:yes stop_codon:yes gene_type:complete